MAIATVLKTVVRKDLGVRIPRPPLALVALTLLLLVAEAVTLGALCGRGEEIHRAALRSDLRNLVTAQEAFREDSGRYATVETLIALGRFRLGTGSVPDSIRSRDDAYMVRLRSREREEVKCFVAVGEGAASEVDPVCTRFGSEVTHTRHAVVYFALLALALGILVRNAATGRMPFAVWHAVVLAVLSVAHPYWDVLRPHMMASCSLGDADYLSILLAGIAAWSCWTAERPTRDEGRA